MKTEIDLEKDFVDAKAVCANKMIKNNRSFLAFCDARTKAFVKNYMKEPTWEWNFSQDDIEAAKNLTFDEWYKKIDVRDYFLDSTLLRDLLAGLSADEVKVLLYSEMRLFYDAFTKDAQKNWAEKDPDSLEEEKCEECEKEEEKIGANKEDNKDDSKEDRKTSQLFTDALNQALNMTKGAADGRAARDALKSIKHCGNDLFCDEDGSENDEDKEESEQYDNDGDFMCADLKDLFKSLHDNIDSLTKELKDIIAEEDKEKEESKKKGKKKKNEDQGD